jgi:hypothetical protein
MEMDKLRSLQAGWRPPLELERSRPRPIRYTVAGKLQMALAVALLAGGVALGAGLHAKATKEQALERQISQAGGRAEGRITRLWRRRSGKETRCYAAYQFRAGAAIYSRTAQVSCSVPGRLQEGEFQRVVFVETNPEVSRLEGVERTSVTPVWLAPVLPVLFAVIAFFVARDLARQRRLLEEGRPTPAVITRWGRRGQHGREVHYEFLTISGSRAKGKFGPVRGGKLPEVGASLAVIYYPDDPGFNRRYPLSAVRVGE